MNNPDEKISRATTISFLVEFARVWSKKKDLSLKLASALIYANFAEFFAADLIYCINYEKDSKLAKLRANTNLDNSLNKLRKLQFPSKAVIIKTLEKIKTDRNDLFHGLIRIIHKENYSIDELILNIKTNTELLMKECINIQPKFPNYDKFLKFALEIAKEKHS